MHKQTYGRIDALGSVDLASRLTIYEERGDISVGLYNNSKMDVIPLSQAEYSVEDVADNTGNKLA